MNLATLEKRIFALQAAYPMPPTFEQFRHEWQRMDSLSKSLYETALSCPQLVGADGRYWETIKSYLLQMGITPELIDLDEILAGLESDTP